VTGSLIGGSLRPASIRAIHPMPHFPQPIQTSQPVVRE
jgi:hypothetical protein